MHNKVNRVKYYRTQRVSRMQK